MWLLENFIYVAHIILNICWTILFYSVQFSAKCGPYTLQLGLFTWGLYTSMSVFLRRGLMAFSIFSKVHINKEKLGTVAELVGHTCCL